MVTAPRSEHMFWGGLLIAGTAYEFRAIHGRPNQTLSDVTRCLFHTRTPAGRVAFTLAWGGLSIWYAQHILRELQSE